MLRDGYTYYCNNPFFDQLNAANDEMDKYYYSLPIDYWIPFAGNEIPRSQQYSAGWKTVTRFGLNHSAFLQES